MSKAIGAIIGMGMVLLVLWFGGEAIVAAFLQAVK